MTDLVVRLPAEKLRAALPVLLAARRAVVLDGTEAIQALQDAGGPTLATWYAREVLLRVVPGVTLQLWQADPSVKQSDRTRAFDRAIRIARAALGHRGGWVVSKAGLGPKAGPAAGAA